MENAGKPRVEEVTKSALVKRMAEAFGMTQKKCAEITEWLLGEIANEAAEGKAVRLNKFGVFKRSEIRFRDMTTGEVKSVRTVRFKPSAAIKRLMVG